MQTQSECKAKLEGAFSDHNKVASAYERAVDALYEASAAAIDANAAKLSADERLERAKKAENDAFVALMAARRQALADTAAAKAHADGLLMADLGAQAAA